MKKEQPTIKTTKKQHNSLQMNQFNYTECAHKKQQKTHLNSKKHSSSYKIVMTRTFKVNERTIDALFAEREQYACQKFK